MGERFYVDRARVVRALAEEADPLVKILRLANNDDGMRKQTTRGHVQKKPAVLNSKVGPQISRPFLLCSVFEHRTAGRKLFISAK